MTASPNNALMAPALQASLGCGTAVRGSEKTHSKIACRIMFVSTCQKTKTKQMLRLAAARGSEKTLSKIACRVIFASRVMFMTKFLATKK